MRRHIFTVSTGRCGEASFAALIDRHVPDAYAAFEEPRADPKLPGAFGDIERRLRRRFVETDELLGRGRVLRAFTQGDDAFIDRVVARRLALIERRLAREKRRIYVDVSKFFARGLHLGFARALPAFGLVLLLRDPVANMRSYLNRGKNFFKDNPPTDAPRNLLRLDPEKLSKAELYLWAWCEMYLRFRALRDSGKVTHSAIIETEEIGRPERMAAHLDALDLPYETLAPLPPKNTNVEQGFGATVVSEADIRTFERFLERLPGAVLAAIEPLRTYRPRVGAWP